MNVTRYKERAMCVEPNIFSLSCSVRSRRFFEKHWINLYKTFSHNSLGRKRHWHFRSEVLTIIFLKLEYRIAKFGEFDHFLHHFFRSSWIFLMASREHHLKTLHSISPPSQPHRILKLNLCSHSIRKLTSNRLRHDQLNAEGVIKHL